MTSYRLRRRSTVTICPPRWRRQHARASCLLFTALLLSGAVVSCRGHDKIESFPSSFAGVGLELTHHAFGFRVVRVFPEGPAARAGVLPDDLVENIDGESLQHKSLGDVVMALRGTPDSQTTLTVTRQNQRIIFVLRRQVMTKTNDEYSVAHPK